MTKNGKTTFVILFSIGFLGAVWSRRAFAGGSAMNVPSNIDSLTRKYCKIFGVPVSLMLAIMGVESSYNPRASNTSERAMKDGGAYGLMQFLLSTAQNLTTKNPSTAAKYWPTFASKYNMTAKGLYDINVSIPMAAFGLASNWKRYKSKPNAWFVTGVSWNQGIGNMDKRLADHNNKLTADDMPPNGKIYWTMLANQMVNNDAVALAVANERASGAAYV